jgi:hypothetical protein
MLPGPHADRTPAPDIYRDELSHRSSSNQSFINDRSCRRSAGNLNSVIINPCPSAGGLNQSPANPGNAHAFYHTIIILDFRFQHIIYYNIPDGTCAAGVAPLGGQEVREGNRNPDRSSRLIIRTKNLVVVFLFVYFTAKQFTCLVIPDHNEDGRLLDMFFCEVNGMFGRTHVNNVGERGWDDQTTSIAYHTIVMIIPDNG